jgi:cell division protease FtsH
MLLLIGVWIFFMRQMQGGGRGGAFSFGKSKARMLDEGQQLHHVRGRGGLRRGEGRSRGARRVPARSLQVPEAGRPHSARRADGRLARVRARRFLPRRSPAKAKVPFFSISGSDFVEMFVGVGAARVRDMFDQAKKNAPCIVFIDEIDAVGRQRGAGLGGGNDEREQTLNQLLVEMDGFEGNAGVIVIAATNRPDVLDPALMRPGRFDRQVVVPLPDIRGREQILLVHMRKVPMSPDVKADIIARGTPGHVRRRPRQPRQRGGIVRGALQQAPRGHARLRAREGQDHHGRGAPLDRDAGRRAQEHRRTTSRATRSSPSSCRRPTPVHKVTIIPRGRALGVTMQLPEQDRYSMDRNHMLNVIAVLFGGRIAEELFMNQMTTGASNDFERATEIARNMVTRYGMSTSWVPMVYGENEGEIFLGRSVTTQKNVSEATMQKVDEEIRKIIDGQYAVARRLLEDNRDKVEAMAQGAAPTWRRLDADQIDDIMSGPSAGVRRVRRTRPSGPSSGGSAHESDAAPSSNPALKHTVERPRARGRYLLEARLRDATCWTFPALGSWAWSTLRSDSFSDGGRYLDPSRAGSIARVNWSPTARTSSTSAANPRARAPRACRGRGARARPADRRSPRQRGARS